MMKTDSSGQYADPSSNPYTIAPMTPVDLDRAVEWAAVEGWNPGLNDASCFYQADPHGFWIGRLAGEAIASISAVRYGESFGFIGFYIVKPEYRGRGYGIQLWNAAIASLGDRTIGLDGVLAQQDNYKKSGFHLSHRNIRFEGRGTDASLHLPTTCVPLTSLNFDEVMAYDRAFFPGDRPIFLRAWLTQSQHYGVGYLSSTGLAGYGILRPCRTGFKIGPLFADTAAVALDIFGALRDRVPAKVPFYLDVPDVNGDAIALAERHQMSRVFETARMYRGDVPDVSVARTYGVTTFELG